MKSLDQRDVALRLLAALEKRAKEKGVTVASFIYREKTPEQTRRRLDYLGEMARRSGEAMCEQTRYHG